MGAGRDRALVASAGLRLGERLVRAGLELVEFLGRYAIVQPPPGVRPPSWAATEAMVEASVATTEDIRRWDQAFRAAEAAPAPVTIFAPLFLALGRGPD